MNKRDLQLQDILSKDLPSDEEIKVYALEGFAKEIDYHNQTELLTKLILDDSRYNRNEKGGRRARKIQQGPGEVGGRKS
jgi:hypothetical protein